MRAQLAFGAADDDSVVAVESPRRESRSRLALGDSARNRLDSTTSSKVTRGGSYGSGNLNGPWRDQVAEALAAIRKKSDRPPEDKTTKKYCQVAGARDQSEAIADRRGSKQAALGTESARWTPSDVGPSKQKYSPIYISVEGPATCGRLCHRVDVGPSLAHPSREMPLAQQNCTAWPPTDRQRRTPHRRLIHKDCAPEPPQAKRPSSNRNLWLVAEHGQSPHCMPPALTGLKA